MKNQVLRINSQPSIIYRSPRKLMWLSLPDLSPINKYYTRANFIQAMGTGSLLVIDKNCINFLTVTLPPLALSLFKQDFLDWEPTGGLCLSSTLILYHKHTINFYERAQNLKKTWTIEVMQQIQQIQSSPQQKVIGMTVKQKRNTVFLWNLHDISNKPFQEISVSEQIVKWQFYINDMLTILTPCGLQVYYPRDGQYSLQFFIQMAHVALDYCFLDRPKVNEHSGRRAVFPVAILSHGGKLYIYDLYDVDKRIKNSLAVISATIETPQSTTAILCGYQNQNGEVILCMEQSSGKPLCLTLNQQLVPKAKNEYLPELNTKNPHLIQYCKEMICTQDQRGEGVKLYRLYRAIGRDNFQFVEEYECDNFCILGGYNFFCFNSNQLTVYPKSKNFQQKEKIVVNDVKINNLFLLEQKENIVYFISGVKIYRLDLENKIFKAHSFTVKSDRLKLIEVRNQTRSLLYKSGDQYVLLQYQTPTNAQNQSQKIVIKTIKSSSNNLISLRNERWVEKLPDKLIFGQSIKVLVEFDLGKFFKLLTQENTLIDYQIYWTTHDGIILLIKNYLFILQLTESSQGYSINPIKRSLNYLHSRFDPDAEGVQVMDARSIVVREGSRIIRLGSKIGNFVSEDPYSLPDTLLRRQLLMRKIYPPHHPKMVQFLIQLGYFNLLDKLLHLLWEWLNDNKELDSLYEKIGADFFINFQGKNDKISPKKFEDQGDQVMKKLCERILQSPHELQLEQNGSLILESQIQALIFRQQNSRALDFYSQIVITQFKTFETKNESFRTMHVAFLLHSINKEEAVGILRREKQEIDWDWMKKYSIVMWYDVKSEIKNWAEEIGTNLFKVNKEPLDCLFWYTVAGKKNVLVQLFKKYLYNTAEHEKIFNFLQRDFNEPKNQKAAVNNAYALVDKKRYFHALAFFIYGQKIDEAVSLCLNKLKDINLAFLMCNVMEDTTNRNKLIDILMKQGDVWAKHIAFFYRNQHIDSFNVLFQEEDINVVSHWAYEPKLTNFHPCLYSFAQNIQKSIPVKRQLQQQQMSQMKSDSNDIFESFYGNESETTVQKAEVERKQLTPNYQWIQKQNIAYFIRNSCPILALMLEPTNHRAKRAYDLCQFVLTKKVNSNVMELIEEMEDYMSIINGKINDGASLKPVLQDFTDKFKKVIDGFIFSTIVITDKNKIGQLMHYGNLGERIFIKLKQSHVGDQLIKLLLDYSEISKFLLILQLQVYEKFEEYSKEFIQTVIQPQKQGKDPTDSTEFWSVIKSYYDKIPQPKKNKKQNLYDTFQQSLYKYAFKKGQLTQQNSHFKISVENCVPIFVRKTVMDTIINILSQKGNNNDLLNTLISIRKRSSSMLRKWADNKVEQELQKEYNSMISEGVVSKLRLNFLPAYLTDKFEPLCRGLLLLRSKSKKSLPLDKSKSIVEPLSKTEIIQIFRSKQESIKFFTINKNEGIGMQLALLTKRGIKKIEVCDSLINRNRTQDGISLIHDETFYNMENQFDFNTMFNNNHLPLIERFLCGVIENRKQYDGSGIIKGSTKRSSPQYLKPLDPPPFFEPTDINCIECHHFLPIYMLGGKSAIQLCNFSNTSNYNRIKCPTMADIVKIRSYEQRVTALDSNGNLNSYSFDSKISGNCVYSLKKAAVIDFCLMAPTIYGICTNNSIQVIDSLLHPKRQTVFKASTNQAPLVIDYFSRTKLAVCRRSDLQVFDMRMDILEQTRDFGGKAKCISSNYKNKILVGKTDNKVRLLNMAGVGSSDDYDMKCVSNYRVGDAMGEKFSIQDIEIMGKMAVVLNSEGVISMFSIQ